MDLEKDAQFNGLGIELISVMGDAPFYLRSEVEKRAVTTIVAADVTLSASKDYGVLGKSMHPGLKPGHSFILVDTGGQIAWRWDWSEDQGPMYVDVHTISDRLSAALGEPGG